MVLKSYFLDEGGGIFQRKIPAGSARIFVRVRGRVMGLSPRIALEAEPQKRLYFESSDLPIFHWSYWPGLTRLGACSIEFKFQFSNVFPSLPPAGS